MTTTKTETVSTQSSPEKMAERLEKIREKREIRKLYKQIRHMRECFDNIISEVTGDHPSTVLVNMHAKAGRELKDFYEYVGCNVYDDGYLIETGLSCVDTRQRRVDEDRVNAYKIIRLIENSKDKNRDEIIKLCETIMRPNDW